MLSVYQDHALIKCAIHTDLCRAVLFAVVGSAEHLITSVKLFRLCIISSAWLLWVAAYVAKLIRYRNQQQ